MDKSGIQSRIRILAVVVLYRMTPSESASLKTLQATVSRIHPEEAEVAILLYDNTPGGQEGAVLPAKVRYIADKENGGLPAAYNCAQTISNEEGFDWLLVLDQDSSLPVDFAHNLCRAVRLVSPISAVAAIAPCVSEDGRVISPGIPKWHWITTKRLPKGFIGIPQEMIYAINSASAFRVSALNDIGGFNSRFFADFSDFDMYHRLQCHGHRVFVAGNIRVEHELSVFDLRSRTSPSRYEKILYAEEAFFDEYLGKMEGFVLLLRLLYRLAYKLCRSKVASPYFRVGLRFLFRRLFYSRERRMKGWKGSAGQRSTS